LEMGGNNPLLVTRVADVKACVYTIIQSAFLTSGQRCSAARRLIVTDDSILAPLVDAASKIKVGAYTDTPEPFMGPVVSKAAADSLEEGYKALKGTPLLAFKRHENFIHPTIIDMTGCPMDDTELFGPILQVVRVKNLEEAIIEANNTSFGLVAGLISDSATDYAQFYEGVKAGVVNWNTPTTGASSSAPFGGIGCSGNYRPSAYFAADYVSYPVASQEVPAVQLPQKIVPGVEL
ncbi:MAG: aldehyde dehydrogenase family protein, partial [Chlamydiales bacterium]|nr:aldehyde dehydrogenase family protein [Chlamydiales bacterium]